MAAQFIDLMNPKQDYSTNLFRVVRLRCHKDVWSPKGDLLIHSSRDEPEEVFLYSTLNAKKKTRSYEWMLPCEAERFKQWELFQTSSIQKAVDVFNKNSIYFLDMEAELQKSELYTYHPVYVLPVHGTFTLMRFVFRDEVVATQYFQLEKDETTVVSTFFPFYKNPKSFHWTETPSRAAHVDTMTYPYLIFVSEFCKLLAEEVCGFPEQYQTRYCQENELPYNPSKLAFTLLSAMGDELPASRPSGSETDESKKSTLMLTEEAVSSLDQQVPPHLTLEEVKTLRTHASHYLEQEQTLYRQAESVLYCDEVMMETWEDLEADKENWDPNQPLGERELSVYDQWVSSLEDPVFQQECHSLWQQMHSEGLLVSAGTL